METVSIYSLSDPRTGRIRYIGKTNNPSCRFSNHLCPSKSQQSHCINWIRSLQKVGLGPVMEILDTVPKLEWVFWEKEYIRLFRAICPDLTNLTDGGDGREGSVISLETRQKLRLANLGKKLSLAHKNKIGKQTKSALACPLIREKMRRATTGSNNGFFGKAHSPETREKIRQKKLGTKATVETREKMAAARTGVLNPNFGKHHNIETKRKIAAAHLGILRGPMSLEQKAKISKTKTGQTRPPFSAIWRKRLSDAGKKRYSKI